ncbi:hypothetical protein R3P38DRAFT_3332818 [Favolaschia claudopus]|uniref:Uncharacterized protein n=1 Tax=Favolaschia claudopus TaxID=2862362 RepID=A0AAV9ZFV2_9AGAR
MFTLYQNFLPQLKSHLLARLLDLPYEGDELDFSDQDHTINPRTNSDIMVLSYEDEVEGTESHPYWYARVIGIFSCRSLAMLGPNRRPRVLSAWNSYGFGGFGRDMTYKAGWKAHRLHRVGFVDFEDGGAFGSSALPMYVIPAFHYGRTSDLLPPSIARRPNQADSDFRFYYIDW